MKYRPEIDVLRTLAVLPVVMYHLKIPFLGGYLFPGGFLGVDVFFVISGFLITKIILDELQQTGHLSIRNFYVRRARRILPALIMVILASMVAAYWILTPSEISRVGDSSLAALGFVSNIYWFFTLGQYGAQSGLLQPLLHTWSLAIEEQFYLVFPLFLLVIKPGQRPKLALTILCALILASLFIAEITTETKRSLSFFSPASRAWEILVGAIMAFGLTYFPKVARPSPWLICALPKLGLAVLVLCMVAVDLSQVNHPGIVTIPTVLATAAIIWYARTGEAVTDMLSTAPFVFVGRLSYSIYLWHFPIFAFGRLSLVEQPRPLDILLWIGLTLMFSIAGYYLVERRFRFGIGAPAFAIATGASLTAIVAFVVVIAQTDTLNTSRTEELVALYGGEFYDNEVLRDRSWSVLDELAGETESIGKWNAHEPSRNEREQQWFNNSDALNLLIVGNSHSKDMFNALHFASESLEGLQVARFGMASGFPATQREQLFESPNFQAADVLMIAPRYDRSFAETVPDFIAELRARGKIVALVGNTVEFISPGSLPIYDYFIRRQNAKGGLENVNTFAFGSQADGLFRLNNELRGIAEHSGALYLSRRELLCSQEDRLCTLVTPEGNKTMYDYGHWTLEGASSFAMQVLDTDWLIPIINEACINQDLCTPFLIQ